MTYFTLPFEPALGLCLAGWLVMTGLLIAARRRVTFTFLYVLAVVGFGLVTGLAAGAVRTTLVAAPSVAAETRPVMLEGWVAGVEPGAKGPRLRIDVHAIAGFSRADTPKYVRLTHMARLEVAPGRFVRCWAVLRPPPAPTLPGDYDFQRQAWFQQLGAVGYVQGRCRGGTLGAPQGWVNQLKVHLSTFRRNLAAHVNVAAGERAGGFAAALVSGDRSFMAQADQDALRGSGLAHLLAISGLHMGIVGGLVFFLVQRGLVLIEPLALRMPVQKPAAATALLASLAYLVLSGASVSTQRAFIMSAVVFGAVLFDRAAISMRSFAIAMIAVVLLEPESVMTPGFQMSFAASGALIATYEAWSHRRAGRERVLGPVPFAWASLVMTSVVAAAATAPFALYHFDRLAGLGLVANLLAMPVITFVSAPMAAVTLLLTPFGYGDVGLRLFGYSLEIVLAIAHWCNDLAPAKLSMPVAMPGLSLACFAAALALVTTARGAGRLLLCLAAAVPGIWLWVASPALVVHWSQSGDVFVRTTSGGLERIAFADGDGLAPLRFSNLDATACSDQTCRFGTQVGTVVLSQSGADQVACEAGVVLVLSLETSGPAERRDGCAPIHDWASIQAAGGFTAHATGKTLEPDPSVGCVRRPWRGCSTDS
ncbi:ComEC/Rec2 family competence protein [Hyphomonas johnsonii]|uniref:ComEC/Rec2 family competence protein n=1 Tax=Hyphomonas johnsonii TaxID=81031 RepID=UPI000A7B85BC|nr:ComEC/Rec2 family competence protein [Hyphomonas johnsonii]